jgi:hypothetical protein
MNISTAISGWYNRLLPTLLKHLTKKIKKLVTYIIVPLLRTLHFCKNYIYYGKAI